MVFMLVIYLSRSFASSKARSLSRYCGSSSTEESAVAHAVAKYKHEIFLFRDNNR